MRLNKTMVDGCFFIYDCSFKNNLFDVVKVLKVLVQVVTVTLNNIPAEYTRFH